MTKFAKEERELLNLIELKGEVRAYKADWPAAFALQARGIISVGWAKGKATNPWRKLKIAHKEAT